MVETLTHHLKALDPDKIIRISGDTDIAITAPFVESNLDVQAGGVFVARRGRSVDGHDFIADALERGAVAIIGDRALDFDKIPYIQIKDTHLATGRLAASYYGFPSRKLTLIGVTGTNGKTTTTHLIHSILKESTGGKAGYISTIGADFGEVTADTGLHVTTPHAQDTQYYLSQMVDAGLTHVVLEMTSHGLVQGRLSGVDIDVAVITNVTHEHLDFHGSFEAYRDAKGLMFQMLGTSYSKNNIPKIAILNADDGSYEHYRAHKADKRFSYSIHQPSDYRATKIQYAPDATRFDVNGTTYSSHLVGEFNVANALAAITTAQGLGIDPATIQQGLSTVTSVSGRMQRIDEGQNFIAVVDFAHTPDALEKALKAARTMLPRGKRIIAVFGSAGLRDIEKRYMMAEVSAQYADVSFLTAEDPRTESLESILKMMAEGCESQGGLEGETFFRVPDRGEAIYRACQLAEPGDMVIACGKGHEQSMCFGTIEYPWDDRDAMRAALRGTPLRTLPTAQS